MSPTHLRFKEISIRRMPGFEDGGFQVKELAAGVNVIYGPNGSGKSTLSHAIRYLLRSDASTNDPITLNAAIEKDGHSLIIDYDYGQVRCQQDGLPLDSIPQLAPPGAEEHCVLALHDLIQSSDGSDLAAEILRRMAGGYDLSEAREALWPRQGPRGKGALHRNLTAAKEAVRNARGEQAALAQSEDQLSGLRQQRENARKAQQRHDQIVDWKKVLKARSDAQRAKAKLDAFPNGMEKLLGNEIKQLTQLRIELAGARQKQLTTTRKLNDAGTTINESPLPAEGVPPESIGALRNKCSQLRDARNELAQKRADQGAAKKRATASASELGSKATLDQAERVDADAIEHLFKLARKAEKIRAHLYASEELRRWLGGAGKREDAALLREGSQLLEQWLAANKQQIHERKFSVIPWIVAGVFCVALALILAFSVHLSCLLFLVVGIGLIAWPFIARHLPLNQGNAIADVERNYTGLGIGAPEQWADADVRGLSRQLQQRHAEAVVEHEKATRWANLASDVEKGQEAKRKLDGYRDRWRKKIGVKVNVDEAESYLLASNLAAWFKSSNDLKGFDTLVAGLERNYSEKVEFIQNAISVFGFVGGKDPETLEAQVEQLSKSHEDHKDAKNEIVGCEKQVAEFAEDILKFNVAIEDVFASVGLSSQDESELQKLVDLHESYLSACTQMTSAEAVLVEVKEGCEVDESIRSMTPEQLDSDHHFTAATAATYDGLNDEIIGIEKEVSIAKQAGNVEQALVNKQDLEDELRQNRDEDYASAVGHLLTEFLTKQQRETEQPRVMRRAQELFVRFTHGRYDLLIDGGDPPMFRAKDTARNVGQALDELSSGTRLQLLLAVHMAFVEEQEGQYKLPLVFDEILGNSDERRAREIIEAAIDICRDGRQVFYFTAQRDEVGKWRSIIGSYKDVAYQETDLAEIRKFSEEERIIAMEFEAPEAAPIPAPVDADWLAYGQLLEIPPIRPRQDIGSTHLWYVVHDPQLLHRLLCGGINRWGQLKTLVQYRSLDGIERSSRAYQYAVAAAKIIESSCRLTVIGRGKPVDRQALLDSGAVSGSFIDVVVDICRTLNGNAAALLQALDDGEVSGFRNNKKQELREHLLDNGFIDENDRLTENEIIRRASTEAFPYVDQGIMDSARVTQLVRSVLRSDTIASAD